MNTVCTYTHTEDREAIMAKDRKLASPDFVKQNTFCVQIPSYR